LQIAQTPSVLAIDDTGATGSPATEAAPGEAVEQAKAPFTPPISTDRTIVDILVATCYHRGCSLRLATDRFLCLFHGRKAREGWKFVEGTVGYPLLTPFYTLGTSLRLCPKSGPAGRKINQYSTTPVHVPCDDRGDGNQYTQ